MTTLLKIPTLAIKVPVYDRVSGSGQDIIDRADSAVRFKQGPLTIICLATSQIAAGGTITPGTNATQLSLADALNQLNT